ncbi:MAG: hypothetical protein RBU37_27815 [Myxococcota bacterium]|jgi:hypothetical protein|nr:hypothetical protein [Myxococcota bacterium]
MVLGESARFPVGFSQFSGKTEQSSAAIDNVGNIIAASTLPGDGENARPGLEGMDGLEGPGEVQALSA